MTESESSIIKILISKVAAGFSLCDNLPMCDVRKTMNIKEKKHREIRRH